MARKPKAIVEFGDFQTPDTLARAVVSAVQKSGFTPETVIEPSCGCGSFLRATADAYPAARLIGLDINAAYLAAARARLADLPISPWLKAAFSSRLGSELAWLATRSILEMPWVTNASSASAAATCRSRQFSKRATMRSRARNFDLSSGCCKIWHGWKSWVRCAA
jgi:hypothetical protein